MLVRSVTRWHKRLIIDKEACFDLRSRDGMAYVSDHSDLIVSYFGNFEFDSDLRFFFLNHCGFYTCFQCSGGVIRNVSISNRSKSIDKRIDLRGENLGGGSVP